MKLKENIFLGTTDKKFQVSDCAISLVNYTKPVSEDWHSHEDIHLSLILQGGNLESRKNQDVQVSPGRIMAYNQGEIHRNRFTAFPSKNLNLEFKSDFFSKNEADFSALTLSNWENEKAYISLIKVYYELQINDIYSIDTIDSLLQSLFIKENISSNKPLWLNRLQEIIEDRWDEFIPLDELAATLNIHPVTISKYFKKFYRGTLGDYMRRIKVHRALYYLFHTEMSITEIALRCGFSDHSHMIRIFKLYIGFNPKRIRKI
ncbi:helix-turn-helix transcriptional regulator [Sediminitomix flava]|uniref:AraC family transcriptional regulator n=1 Tax=Sediminitomix flava TaxID=379075 RepID=A0A315YY16_SEDFL|nr:AraC family transcriptional regulator [Sediminitomix flava]PWJ35022.1 AraC family transcriptional regulator [Sediminitomix flava]